MTVQRSRTFGRYLIVGGCLFLIDFVLFMLLVRVAGLDLRIAQAVSRSTGASVGFFAHRHVSFQATGERAAFHWLGQGAGYIVAAAVLNVLISPFVVWMTFVLLHGRLVAAKLMSDGLMVIFSYVLLRLVFRTHEARGPEASPQP